VAPNMCSKRDPLGGYNLLQIVRMRPPRLGIPQLLSLALLGFPIRIVAQGPITVAHRAIADSCLPPTEYQLGDIELHSDAVAAVSTLKPPVRKFTRTGEDDGGRYAIETYESPALSIQIGRGMIERLATHSPTISTPSGMRPGMIFDTAKAILRTKGVALKQFADTVDIGVCSTTEGILLEDFLTLIFDRQRRLRVLELSFPTP
jgi:hypothetical protein